MGVLNCSKLGCEKIGCDTYVPEVGYVCNDCEEYLHFHSIELKNTEGFKQELQFFIGIFKGEEIEFFNQYR